MTMQQRDAGFGFVAVIVAAFFIVLAMRAAFMRDQVTAGAALHDATAQAKIVAGATLIAQRVLGCATAYPNALTGGHYPSFPAVPGSNLASDLICPGNSTSLWAGQDGVFMPAEVKGFTAWTYTNSADGVFIETSTNTQGAALIESAADRLGATASLLTFDLARHGEGSLMNAIGATIFLGLALTAGIFADNLFRGSLVAGAARTL